MGSCVVISQPMLMPWTGMFEQIRLCDQFVFYDDVQLPAGGGRGRGFITRVQIKTPNGIDWLSLPIHRAGQHVQTIAEARLADTDWRRAHLDKIRHAYRTAPYFDAVFASLLEPIYAFQTEHVSRFCMHSMNVLCAHLGLAPRTCISSELGVATDLHSSERVLAICRHLGASDYVSGLGAMDYIDYGLFEEAGVKIRYMDYAPRPYPQLHGAFTPYVSILDLFFNVGLDDARRYLGSGAVYWKDWPHRDGARPCRRPG